MATAHERRVRLESIYHPFSNASHDYKLNPLLFNSMLVIEDSPLSVETPATPAHGTNTQTNTTHHMGAAALQVDGIAFTRRYVTK